LADNVNLMAANLTARNIAEVTTAVDNGDLSRKIAVRSEGRNSRPEEQHDESAQFVRLRSNARGA
jgi:hypothetical protein